MRWKGESRAQFLDRTSRWHRRFCWFPVQTIEGTWVWLECCWARRFEYYSGEVKWSYSDSVEQPDQSR